ncbi:hypothetical protein LINPERPRIM_LOCUS5543 [Linum perenne]
MGLLITTLCVVIACGIIFHNFSGKGKSKRKEDPPEVRPSVPDLVEVLKKFRGLPKKKQEKNKLNHETPLEKSLRKMKNKLNDKIKKNTLMEMELILMEDLPPICEEDSNEDAKKKLNCKRENLREIIKAVTERIDNFESEKKNN